MDERWLECDFGSVEAVTALLDAGAEANASFDSGYTPLVMASQAGNEAVIDLLLARGSNAAAAAEDGRTALLVASAKGHLGIVERLLGAGASPNAKTMSGWTPLMVASRGGQTAIVQRLLDAGAEVNAIDGIGWTALHSACVGGALECVQLLIDHGARTDIRNEHNQSAIGLAIDSDNAPVAEFLKTRGVSLDATDQLVVAVKNRDHAAAKKATGAGADLGAYAILWSAYTTDDLDTMRVLLDAGADPDVPDVDGDTILGLAAERGEADVIRLFVEKGANVDAVGEEGASILRKAATSRNWDGIVAVLAASFEQALEGDDEPS